MIPEIIHYSNKILNNEPIYNLIKYYNMYIKNIEKKDIIKICKVLNKDNIYMCYIVSKQLKHD